MKTRAREIAEKHATIDEGRVCELTANVIEAAIVEALEEAAKVVEEAEIVPCRFVIDGPADNGEETLCNAAEAIRKMAKP